MQNERPTFSIVVPTYERPVALASCLSAITALDYPRDGFEVIVVDDGGVSDLSGALAQAGPIDVRMVRRSNGGPGAARNTGARAARGHFLAFTDDDCRPLPDWLHALELAARDHCMVGGRTLNGRPENVFSRASQLIVDNAYAHFREADGRPAFFASNNLAVPREHFLELGGFDETFQRASEDRELCDRWRSRGLEMCYAPGAVVHHRQRQTLPGFLRQHFNYGRGAARYHRLTRARGTGVPGDDVRSHAAFLARFRDSVGLLPARARLGTVVALGLWQLANVAGFAIEEAHHRLSRSPNGDANPDPHPRR